MAGAVRRLAAAATALSVALILATAGAAIGASNDAFAYAATLEDVSGRVHAWVSDASREAGEPSHAGQTGTGSVWYRWTPATSGTAVFATNGSDYDTLLAVYTGRRVDRLTSVAADDNGAGSEVGTSRVQFAAVAGTPYLIAVDRKGTLGRSLLLTWNLPIPANDNVASATAIGESTGSRAGTTLWATTEPGEAGEHIDEPASVWYAYRAPADGSYRFETAGAVDARIQLRVPGPLGQLPSAPATYQDPAGNGMRAFAALTAGQQIMLRIVTAWDAPGGFALAWAPQARPPNDNFANATALSGFEGARAGDNTAATGEAGEPAHLGVTGWQRTSIWYRWTPSVSGSVFVQPTGLRTLTAVYAGSRLDQLQLIDGSIGSSADDGGAGWVAEAGTTYRIVVEGASAQTGPLTLTWGYSPPSNDDFASRDPLLGMAGRETTNNVAATAEPGEPGHAGLAATRSLWWSYRPHLTGTLALNTGGSGIDTVLAAYRGSSLSALSSVASNDNDGTATSSRISFKMVAGQEYQIAVAAPSGGRGSVSLSWSFTADPPPNDAWAAAVALIGLEGDLRTSNLSATAETGEPAHAGVPAASSIWYRWVAPATGRAMFTTMPWDYLGGTNIDTTLAVYRGTSLSALTRVDASNDYEPPFTGSRVHFPVTRGTAYYIVVDGVGGAEGNIRLRWTAPPVNDELANALVLSGDAGSVTGTALRATGEANEPGLSGGFTNSVWYRWIAPQTRPMQVTLDAATSNIGMAVMTGALMDKLEAAGGGIATTTDGRFVMRFWATAGTTYRFSVSSDGWGPFTLGWGPTGAPTNDNFSSATPLTGIGPIEQQTSAATREAAEPYHTHDAAGAQSVWYSYTATASGTLLLDSTGSDYGVVLAAYRGTTLGAAERIAGHHDATGARATRLRIGVSAGTTYRIAVAAAGQGGLLRLTWARVADPPNDNFAASRALSGGRGTLVDDNDGASREAGEPIHVFDRSAGASLWFRWTAPASGLVSFDTLGAEIDTLLAVYTGNSVETLSRIASNRNAGFGIEASRVTFSAVSGTTYRIVVDTSSSALVDVAGVTGSFPLSWNQPATPRNDAFELAERIGYGTGDYRLYVEGDNRNATVQAGEPRHAGVVGGRSVWFSWTAPSSEAFVAHTRGTRFDTLLGVYEGSGLAGLRAVAADDDGGGVGTSRAQFTAVEGRTYWIAIDGKGGASGPIALYLNIAIAPDNDGFLAGSPITGTSGQVTGTTVGATWEFDEPSHAVWGANHSVWYRWTAPASGTYTFSTPDGSIDSLISIYRGAELQSLEVISTTEGFAVQLGATAGATYQVAVDDFGGTGWFVLDWRPTAGAPSNDNFAAAQTITGTSGRLDMSTVKASPEADEPLHGGTAGGASIWTRWTAPASGVLSLSTSGSAIDTTLSVGSGSSLAAIKLLATNDDAQSTVRTSAVRIPVSAGIVYRIAIDAVNRSPWTDTVPTGGVRLNWSLATRPPNDDLAAAHVLTGTGGTIAGTTIAATMQPGEPTHGDGTTGASIWYRWTAPASGSVLLDASPGAATTRVAVYRGTAVHALTLVRRSDIGSSASESVRIAVVSGQTYLIALDGAGGGTGTTSMTFAYAPPPNDAFAAATGISGRHGSAGASTAGATVETGEPLHAGLAGGHSIWYRWTAPASETVVFSSAGSTFDTLLAAYTGTAVNSLTPVRANDNAATLRTSAIELDVVAGRVYQIALDGRGGAVGNTELTWFTSPEPPNDDFEKATKLVGESGLVEATTFNGDWQAGELPHAGRTTGATIWYAWTAPRSGATTLNVIPDHGWDSLLVVYTGDRLDGLTRVIANADHPEIAPGSRATWTARAGVTYRIVVVGERGTSGALWLDWAMAP